MHYGVESYESVSNECGAGANLERVRVNAMRGNACVYVDTQSVGTRAFVSFRARGKAYVKEYTKKYILYRCVLVYQSYPFKLWCSFFHF